MALGARSVRITSRPSAPIPTFSSLTSLTASRWNVPAVRPLIIITRHCRPVIPTIFALPRIRSLCVRIKKCLPTDSAGLICVISALLGRQSQADWGT
jgi:hypothetical protein